MFMIDGWIQLWSQLKGTVNPKLLHSITEASTGRWRTSVLWFWLWCYFLCCVYEFRTGGTTFHRTFSLSSFILFPSVKAFENKILLLCLFISLFLFFQSLGLRYDRRRSHANISFDTISQIRFHTWKKKNSWKRKINSLSFTHVKSFNMISQIFLAKHFFFPPGRNSFFTCPSVISHHKTALQNILAVKLIMVLNKKTEAVTLITLKVV